MLNAPVDLPETSLPVDVVEQATQSTQELDVDLQALAREVLALFKEELLLEKERLGFRRYSTGR